MKARNSGFSLLETLLAIGILSTMLMQVISMHTNSLAASQTALNNMKATWALRQGMGQLQYIIDVYGSKDGARFKDISIPWTADSDFTIKIVTKDFPIEASQLLVSAFRIGTAFTSGGAEKDEGASKDDPAESIKAFAEQVNAFVPKDIYRTVNIEVSWKQGEMTKSLDTGFFLIDSKALKEKASTLSTLANMAGMGGMGGSDDKTGSGEAKNPPNNPGSTPTERPAPPPPKNPPPSGPGN